MAFPTRSEGAWAEGWPRWCAFHGLAGPDEQAAESERLIEIGQDALFVLRAARAGYAPYPVDQMLQEADRGYMSLAQLVVDRSDRPLLKRGEERLKRALAVSEELRAIERQVHHSWLDLSGISIAAWLGLAMDPSTTGPQSIVSGVADRFTRTISQLDVDRIPLDNVCVATSRASPGAAWLACLVGVHDPALAVSILNENSVHA